jgi:hypothetical protein
MVFEMADVPASSVEPFVERVSVSHASADGHFFRVGYRTEGTDHIISAVDLPNQILEQEIALGLQLVTTITASGEIVSQIVGSSGLSLLKPRSIASIHDLISEAVSMDSLRREEVSTNELCGLLRTLESAISRVRAALAQTTPEA